MSGIDELRAVVTKGRRSNNTNTVDVVALLEFHQAKFDGKVWRMRGIDGYFSFGKYGAHPVACTAHDGTRHRHPIDAGHAPYRLIDLIEWWIERQVRK